MLHNQAIFHSWVNRLSSQGLHTRQNAQQDKAKPRSNWVNRTQGQANIPWVYRLLRQWKGKMTKLVAHSRSRDTSTRSIWPGIHNTYTPNTRKNPLLCSTVPWAMHSFPVLFRVCIGYLLATLIFLWVFTMHYVYQGHSSSLPLLSHSYSSDPNQGSHHNKPQGDTTT